MNRELDGVLVLGAAVVMLACGQPDAAPPPAPVASEPVVLVETTQVQRGAIRSRIVVAGSLEARRKSQIGSRVPGRIEKLHVQVGDRVAAGDVLFEVESHNFVAALRQAEAGLDLARAQRREIEEDLVRQEQILVRELVAEQVVARLRTQVEVAKARERQAGQAVEIARQNLADTKVRAPYGGSIARRLADEGTSVIPQSTVVELQETSQLEARAAIAESNLGLVRAGDRVGIRVQGRRHPIVAQVSAVSDTIDPATRTYLVRVAVPNPDHGLPAGVFARLEITPQSGSEVLLVPRSALCSEEGKSHVFVIRDGRAQPVTIEIGVVTEDAAEVIRGLSEGDTVIVGESAHQVAPGTKVMVSRTLNPRRGDAT
jgi:membrane fusion protein (multidrug efflux system)